MMKENTVENINKCLLELSDALDRLLLNQQENPKLLNNIENWMQTHFSRIQLEREKNNKIVIRSLDNQETRQDALFIFDSSLQIISYSGTQNFFSDSDKTSKNNLSLLDIIEEASLPRWKLLIEKAIESRTSLTLNLRIKTNINVLNNCTFDLDMLSSNPDNDRFVARLKFSEILATQLLEYQALILDSLPGMDIYLFDKNYTYLFAAGKEKERFELNNIEFLGKTLFNVLEKKAVRLIYPCITKALQGAENEGEIRYEGEVYYMKGTPVKDYNNETVGAILFSQNITSDKLLEEQLKKSREEALNADKLKSIFIANISHEIRTPLNSIIGFTDLLAKTNVNQEQEKYLNLIQMASNHLLYLVTEVVFLFKLGMGKVYLETSPFSLHELMQELKETFQKQASDKNLTFETLFDEKCPDALIGDQFRLRQILMNVLVNAIKYTDNGGVTFTCKVKKETKKRIDLVFKIKDTGVGIKKSELNNIFNVFEQGNKLNSSFRGGAGLGLGICKNLVELLQGQISVISKDKVGSTFTILLPFEKAQCSVHYPPKKIDYDPVSDAKLLQAVKILVADDDEHNRILAENILTGWLTDFVIVKDGQEAIELLNKKLFDLALIDINMPNKNGIDVVHHVRSNNTCINYKTPIVFMTANAFKRDINLYIKAGFDDYLIKPFREAELYNKLCTILEIKKPESHNKMTMVEHRNSSHIQVDNFNTKELLKTSNNDLAFFEKMVNNFIVNSQALINVFIEEAANGNWNEIGEKAHKAIPSFKYFELFKIAAALSIIEDKTLRKVDYPSAATTIEQTIIQIKDAIEQAKASLGQKM